MPKDTSPISLDSQSPWASNTWMQNTLSPGAVWIMSYGMMWIQSHYCIECFCMEQDMAEKLFHATSLTYCQSGILRVHRQTGRDDYLKSERYSFLCPFWGSPTNLSNISNITPLFCIISSISPPSISNITPLIYIIKTLLKMPTNFLAIIFGSLPLCK